MRQFPSQVVSDIEKLSYDYGLKIAQAIEAEWFDKENQKIKNIGLKYLMLA